MKEETADATQMKVDTKFLVWAGVGIVALHLLLYLVGWSLQRRVKTNDTSQL